MAQARQPASVASHPRPPGAVILLRTAVAFTLLFVWVLLALVAAVVVVFAWPLLLLALL